MIFTKIQNPQDDKEVLLSETLTQRLCKLVVRNIKSTPMQTSWLLHRIRYHLMSSFHRQKVKSDLFTIAIILNIKLGHIL